MITAIFGLIGVVIGALLTALKDWWFRKSNKKEDQIYLAIHISCLLERFIAECVDVAYDDGLYEGQRGDDGCLAVQVSPPNFEPLQFKDVNWKSLPANLMYRVLRLPTQIQDADTFVAETFKHVAFPPDYEELFEARKEKYSELGLQAIEVLDELCVLAGLPNELQNYDEDWAPKTRLKQALHEVKSEKAERDARIQVPPLLD